MRQFLIHDTRDNVGVAVVDLKPGQAVAGAALDDGHLLHITACEAIPLGHKIALMDLRAVSI